MMRTVHILMSVNFTVSSVRDAGVVMLYWILCLLHVLTLFLLLFFYICRLACWPLCVSRLVNGM